MAFDSPATMGPLQMHGIIHTELQRYVTTKLGVEAWAPLLADAGLPNKRYLMTQVYPDEEAGALVGAAVRRTGLAAAVILEDLGAFLVPTLMKVYKPFVKPHWRTLDVIEHTEATIHKAVRMRNPGARPAELKTTRMSPTEVVLVYGSARRMCAVARGIARGMAEHYSERIEITERACMHRGAAECTLSIKRVA